MSIIQLYSHTRIATRLLYNNIEEALTKLKIRMAKQSFLGP